MGLILNHYSIIRLDFFITLDSKSFYIAAIVFLLPLCFFTLLVSAYLKIITIDTIRKTVTFKNILTRQTKTYDFDSFDGLIDTFLNHRNIFYKTVAFIKDKKQVRYIDSFWVSNYDEMRQSLHGISFLGTYNFSAWKRLKFLLKKQVIN
jgi:hypothetical protein